MTNDPTPSDRAELRRLCENANAGIYIHHTAMDLNKYVPRLLDQVERLEAENKRLRKLVWDLREFTNAD